MGHIAIDCPLAPLKHQNQTYQCGCNPNEIEAQRQYYHSNHHTHHCCHCKNPQRPETLQELDKVLVCKGCYTDFHQSLDHDDPRSQYYYTQGDGCGTLVECKLCKHVEPRNRIHNLESITEELWLYKLEHLYAYKASTDVLYNYNYNL
jgi:hypothetical protein